MLEFQDSEKKPEALEYFIERESEVQEIPRN